MEDYVFMDSRLVFHARRFFCGMPFFFLIGFYFWIHLKEELKENIFKLEIA
jgi:hypothetical protein